MDIAATVAHAPPGRRGVYTGKAALLGFALAGLAASGTAAQIALGGAPSNPALVALARALIVGVPIAAGIYAWWSASNDRFGLLLLFAGAGSFLTTFAESSDDLLYTIGRAAGWFLEVLFVYLILSFPSGRLPERADRLLVGAMGAVVLTMYLPRLALGDHFEVPSPYTSCTAECPSNAFFLFADEPAIVDAVLRPVGVLLVFAVMVTAVVRLALRIRDATPLARRMFTPILMIGGARAGILGVAIVARQLSPSGQVLQGASWLIALALPAIAIAFLLGLLRWQLFSSRALQRLAACLREVPNAATLRRAFAEAFNDPTIQIVFPVRDGTDRWIDCWGRPATLPGPGEGHGVREVRNDGIVVAAVVYDEALGTSPRLVEAGVEMASVVLDNQRLAAETEAAMREVRRSRARIAAGAERERRRIERDLHDGAQQRLVALRIELELAQEVIRRDPDKGIDRLRELEHEVDYALEDLRSLAHGVYPPLLADRGLEEALRGAALRSPLTVEIQAHDIGRYALEVESAVYFCVLEALQNVLKHAVGARRTVVRLDGATRGELRFSVRDDGAGAAEGDMVVGAGITNMHDRLEAVGGELELASTPGVGTTVRGHVPTAGQPAV